MSYYRLLGLHKEPFSTSPDPLFFYESPEHRSVLARLMIEIRLKRGLSVVLGDVGAGKTTLARKLYLMIAQRPDIVFHMILDPTYDTEELFLGSLVRAFGLRVPNAHPTILDFKEAIRLYLIETAQEQGKTVVLLIDEAQKLNAASLEILRVLLNYETTDQKLLQLLMLGQLELVPIIAGMPNLQERINTRFTLVSFSAAQTAEMIAFRLRVAGWPLGESLFTDEALARIHVCSRGCPRRIAMLAHAALKELVMSGKRRVDGSVVRGLVEEQEQFYTYARIE